MLQTKQNLNKFEKIDLLTLEEKYSDEEEQEFYTDKRLKEKMVLKNK